MREVEIKLNGVVPSNVGFASTLCMKANGYVSDILICTESENNVSQQVDLKSLLGVMALNYCTDKIKLKIFGEDENSAAFGMTRAIEDLIKMYK